MKLKPIYVVGALLGLAIVSMSFGVANIDPASFLFWTARRLFALNVVIQAKLHFNIGPRIIGLSLASASIYVFWAKRIRGSFRSLMNFKDLLLLLLVGSMQATALLAWLSTSFCFGLGVILVNASPAQGGFPTFALIIATFVLSLYATYYLTYDGLRVVWRWYRQRRARNVVRPLQT